MVRSAYRGCAGRRYRGAPRHRQREQRDNRGQVTVPPTRRPPASSPRTASPRRPAHRRASRRRPPGRPVLRRSRARPGRRPRSREPTTPTPPVPTVPTVDSDEAGPAVAGPCSGVVIKPSDDAQSIINAKPAGTTFCFAAGVHRIAQTLRPKADQVLASADRAVLSGSVPLTGWAKSGANWVVRGALPAAYGMSGQCEDNKANVCYLREQVFVDGTPPDPGRERLRGPDRHVSTPTTRRTRSTSAATRPGTRWRCRRPRPRSSRTRPASSYAA